MEVIMPLGWRCKNPGNIRPNRWKWDGEIEPLVTPTAGSYCQFVSPVMGIRALIRDNRNKRRRGLNTIRKIKAAYAPAADNNDVGAYARRVASTLSRLLGIVILPDDQLPADTVSLRTAMAKATVLVELGNPYNYPSPPVVLPYWYDDNTYLEAARLEDPKEFEHARD